MSADGGFDGGGKFVGNPGFGEEAAGSRRARFLAKVVLVKQ